MLLGLVSLACVAVIAIVLALTITRLQMVRRDVTKLAERVAELFATDLLSLKEFEQLDPDVKRLYRTQVTAKIAPAVMRVLNREKSSLGPLLTDEAATNALVDAIVVGIEQPPSSERSSSSQPQKSVETYVDAAVRAFVQDRRRHEG